MTIGVLMGSDARSKVLLVFSGGGNVVFPLSIFEC